MGVVTFLQVRDHVTERCADVFDENLLNVTLDELQALLNGWLTAIYGNGCGTSYYYYYYYR